MTKTFLKVKINTLAAEARIIKREEHRTFTRIEYEVEGWDPVTKKATGQKKTRVKYVKRDRPLRMALRAHRISAVRSEARASLLAYGFMRGRTLKMMEDYVHAPILQVRALDRALAIAQAFSTDKNGGKLDKRVVAQKFEQWRQGK